ncbi:MAG: RnfABCDGE type electron transport complex subunit D [Clostridia bacterium]
MKLYLSTAPHIRCPENTTRLMGDVIIALLPATIAGVYYFGMGAAAVIAISIASAVLFEFLWQKLTKQAVRIGDLSAVVTGLILGLNLPPTSPWWMPIIGSGIAIVLVKQLFGGIGDNFLNPALAARAVLLTSWPVRMTSFVLPTKLQTVDAVASATPLAGYPATTMDLLLGNVPGSIGEVCKAAILLGFIYMLIRHVIAWRIPVIMVASYALFALIFGNDVLVGVLSGGLLFGAVFMATDYTTSPMTQRGQYIYAAGCGLLVAVIRNFGSYPEGVTYAILIMNITTPLIDKYVKPRLYGEVKADAKQ